MGDQGGHDRRRTIDLRERELTDADELEGADVIILSTSSSGITRRKISRRCYVELIAEAAMKRAIKP